MADEDKKFSKQLIGKTIVSKTGKTFGKVDDIVFETRTGELIYLVLNSPTTYATTFDLEKSRSGGLQIPFSSVVAIGDFIVIDEQDLS